MNLGLGLGLFFDRANAEFAQLLGRDGSGRLGHEVLATLRLGEGNDVANRTATGEHRHHAVKAEGDTTVGWRTVREGFQHVTKATFNNVLGDL